MGLSVIDLISFVLENFFLSEKSLYRREEEEHYHLNYCQPDIKFAFLKVGPLGLYLPQHTLNVHGETITIKLSNGLDFLISLLEMRTARHLRREQYRLFPETLTVTCTQDALFSVFHIHSGFILFECYTTQPRSMIYWR